LVTTWRFVPKGLGCRRGLSHVFGLVRVGIEAEVFDAVSIGLVHAAPRGSSVRRIVFSAKKSSTL
jgi:hypothetical protein